MSAGMLLLLSVAASAVGATYLYSSDIADSNELPQAQIAGLAEGEVLPAGHVKLKGSAADDGAIRAVSVRVDGGSPIPVIPDSTDDFAGWTVSLNLDPGNHTIEVETVDDLGKTNTTKMSVIATDVAMAMPADKIVEATAPSGALLRYDLPTVQENVRILGGPDCSPASGTKFPIGTTTVTCTALFAGDNTVTADFAVSVRDSRPPTIKAPPDVAAENHGVVYVKVSLGKPTVSDAVDESPTVSNNAPANGFVLGTTTVVWTAVDEYGNTATATQKVTVVVAEDSNDDSDDDGGSKSTTTTYSGGGGGGGGGSSSSNQEQSDEEEGGYENSGDDGGSNTAGGNGGSSGGNNGSSGDDGSDGNEDDGDDISLQYVLTINSVDLSGNAIAGISATISSSGSTLQTGGTPLTFAGNSTYTVTVTDPDGVTFDHWDNGATTLARTITLNQNRTIVAHYSIDPVEVPDTTDPSVQITSIDDDSTIAMPDGGLITVEGTASDDDGSGIEVVEVRIDDGDYVEATPVAEGDWSSWSVTLEVSAGERRLVPRATDNAGNQAWNSIYITVAEPPSDGDGGGDGSSGGDSDALDDFGIEKIYQTKSGGNEWYVDMDDPTSDPLFRNLPSMTRQSDGSWQVNGGSRGQVRMEAWSPSNEKWLNVEITGYAKMISGSNELIQWYSRGGHHTSSNECLGSAVKARLYGDGEARWVKEINHPAYSSNRGSVQATNEPLDDRWIGFKAVMYNFVENGRTYVRMESYIDDDITGADGNLVIDNDWQLSSVVEDRGGWSTGSSDFNSSCSPLNKDSSQQYRQRDEILNMPGGTATQNIAAWRSDDLTWNWKYLSVREIVPPS